MNTKQQLLQNPLVKEIALKFANEFRVTELCENMWDDFVKSNEPVREWEILEFVGGQGEHLSIRPNGLFSQNSDKGVYRQSAMLQDHAVKILSVKRMSDGEIFVVGDNTQVGEITSFEIQGQNMIAKGSDFEWHLNQLEKAKKVIFTTDDHINIYEGDEYFFCGEPLVVYSSKAVWYDIDGALQNTGNKHFSTREKAEEYITLNKPCLSVSDVLSFTFSESVHVKRLQEQLLELAKSKQNNS